jgi:cation transport ATPase
MLKQRSSEKACKVVSVVILGDCHERVVLALAASLARTLDEALSTAIVATVSEDVIVLPKIDHVQVITDKGVTGSVDGHAVILGNSSFLSDLGVSVANFGAWAERTAPDGETVLFVALDGHLAGFLRLVLKEEI